MPTFAIDDRRLSYEDYGSGPVVLLIHGSPGNAKAWARVGERLAGRYRVIAPDLPGYGESTPQPPGEDPDVGYHGSATRLATATHALTTTHVEAVADAPMLGQPISEADIKARDISVLPDGTNLPPGSGTYALGARIYAEKCAGCHGEGGKGGPNNALIGGEPLSSRIEATKTIANFWQYATTVFDYIRRAMPWPNPRTLTDDEVYALTAYILALNKITGEKDVMNAQTLPKVRMPNRGGFIIPFPDKI